MAKDDEKSNDSTKAQVLAKGEAFLKKLREMPYTNDRVGQSFVILQSPIYLDDVVNLTGEGGSPDH